MSDHPSQLLDRFIVRLPDGLRDQIKSVAEANSRSMNAEIVAVLTAHYRPEKGDDEAVAFELRRLADLLSSR